MTKPACRPFVDFSACHECCAEIHRLLFRLRCVRGCFHWNPDSWWLSVHGWCRAVCAPSVSGFDKDTGYYGMPEWLEAAMSELKKKNTKPNYQSDSLKRTCHLKRCHPLKATKVFQHLPTINHHQSLGATCWLKGNWPSAPTWISVAGSTNMALATRSNTEAFNKHGAARLGGCSDSLGWDKKSHLNHQLTVHNDGV